MAPEDVSNIDEIVLLYYAEPTKTLARGKVCGCKVQMDRLTLALVVYTIGTNKLKLIFIYKSTPNKLWNVEACHKFCVMA